MRGSAMMHLEIDPEEADLVKSAPKQVWSGDGRTLRDLASRRSAVREREREEEHLGGYYLQSTSVFPMRTSRRGRSRGRGRGGRGRAERRPHVSSPRVLLERLDLNDSGHRFVPISNGSYHVRDIKVETDFFHEEVDLGKEEITDVSYPCPDADTVTVREEEESVSNNYILDGVENSNEQYPPPVYEDISDPEDTIEEAAIRQCSADPLEEELHRLLDTPSPPLEANNNTAGSLQHLLQKPSAIMQRRVSAPECSQQCKARKRKRNMSWSLEKTIPKDDDYTLQGKDTFLAYHQKLKLSRSVNKEWKVVNSPSSATSPDAIFEQNPTTLTANSDLVSSVMTDDGNQQCDTTDNWCPKIVSVATIPKWGSTLDGVGCDTNGGSNTLLDVDIAPSFSAGIIAPEVAEDDEVKEESVNHYNALTDFPKLCGGDSVEGGGGDDVSLHKVGNYKESSHSNCKIVLTLPNQGADCDAIQTNDIPHGTNVEENNVVALLIDNDNWCGSRREFIENPKFCTEDGSEIDHVGRSVNVVLKNADSIGDVSESNPKLIASNMQNVQVMCSYNSFQGELNRSSNKCNTVDVQSDDEDEDDFVLKIDEDRLSIHDEDDQSVQDKDVFICVDENNESVGVKGTQVEKYCIDKEVYHNNSSSEGTAKSMRDAEKNSVFPILYDRQEVLKDRGIMLKCGVPNEVLSSDKKSGHSVSIDDNDVICIDDEDELVSTHTEGDECDLKIINKCDFNDDNNLIKHSEKCVVDRMNETNLIVKHTNDREQTSEPKEEYSSNVCLSEEETLNMSEMDPKISIIQVSERSTPERHSSTEELVVISTKDKTQGNDIAEGSGSVTKSKQDNAPSDKEDDLNSIVNSDETHNASSVAVTQSGRHDSKLDEQSYTLLQEKIGRSNLTYSNKDEQVETTKTCVSLKKIVTEHFGRISNTPKQKVRSSRKNFRHDTIKTFKVSPPVSWMYKGKVNPNQCVEGTAAESGVVITDSEADISVNECVPVLQHIESVGSDELSDMVGSEEVIASTVPITEDAHVKKKKKKKRLHDQKASKKKQGASSSEASDDSSRIKTTNPNPHQKEKDMAEEKETSQKKSKDKKRARKSSIMEEVSKRFLKTQMHEKGLRLAQEIPRFNWLEEKIRKGKAEALKKAKKRALGSNTEVTEEAVVESSQGQDTRKSQDVEESQASGSREVVSVPQQTVVSPPPEPKKHPEQIRAPVIVSMLAMRKAAEENNPVLQHLTSRGELEVTISNNSSCNNHENSASKDTTASIVSLVPVARTELSNSSLAPIPGPFHSRHALPHPSQRWHPSAVWPNGESFVHNYYTQSRTYTAQQRWKESSAGGTRPMAGSRQQSGPSGQPYFPQLQEPMATMARHAATSFDTGMGLGLGNHVPHRYPIRDHIKQRPASTATETLNSRIQAKLQQYEESKQNAMHSPPASSLQLQPVPRLRHEQQYNPYMMAAQQPRMQPVKPAAHYPNPVFHPPNLFHSAGIPLPPQAFPSAIHLNGMPYNLQPNIVEKDRHLFLSNESLRLVPRSHVSAIPQRHFPYLPSPDQGNMPANTASSKIISTDTSSDILVKEFEKMQNTVKEKSSNIKNITEDVKNTLNNLIQREKSTSSLQRHSSAPPMMMPLSMQARNISHFNTRQGQYTSPSQLNRVLVPPSSLAVIPRSRALEGNTPGSTGSQTVTPISTSSSAPSPSGSCSNLSLPSTSARMSNHISSPQQRILPTSTSPYYSQSRGRVPSVGSNVSSLPMPTASDQPRVQSEQPLCHESLPPIGSKRSSSSPADDMTPRKKMGMPPPAWKLVIPGSKRQVEVPPHGILPLEDKLHATETRVARLNSTCSSDNRTHSEESPIDLSVAKRTASSNEPSSPKEVCISQPMQQVAVYNRHSNLDTMPSQANTVHETSRLRQHLMSTTNPTPHSLGPAETVSILNRRMPNLVPKLSQMNPIPPAITYHQNVSENRRTHMAKKDLHTVPSLVHSYLFRGSPNPSELRFSEREPFVGNTAVGPTPERMRHVNQQMSPIAALTPELPSAANCPQSVPAKYNCTNCNAEAKFMCSACQTAWYCDPACQMQHWTYHNLTCQKIRNH